MKLTTQHHMAPKLRMSAAVPLFPCMPSWNAEEQFYLFTLLRVNVHATHKIAVATLLALQQDNIKYSTKFTFLVPESCGLKLSHLIITRHSVYMPGSTAALNFSSPPSPGASTFTFCCSSCMCLFFLTATLRTRRWTRPYRDDATVTHCIVHIAYHPGLTVHMPAL